MTTDETQGTPPRGAGRHFGDRVRRAVCGGFAMAALLVLVVPASTGCGGDDDCLEHGENCSAAFLEREGRSGASCCEGRVCCVLAGGSGVQTCQRSGSCE